MQTYSFSSCDPRLKRKSCGRGTPKNDTRTLTPHQCKASCKGKCFSSFSCRNYLRSHSTHGLEVAKRLFFYSPFTDACEGGRGGGSRPFVNRLSVWRAIPIPEASETRCQKQAKRVIHLTSSGKSMENDSYICNKTDFGPEKYSKRFIHSKI